MVMDRASWLWRRKSSDKSPGGSDSSMSVSSHSEQCSDDQEILRPISNNASPCHGQSREASSRSKYDDSQEAGVTKSLNGKLAAVVNLNDSTPQHGQSVEPYVSSNVRDEAVKETMKSLNDKLFAALLTVRSKEDLVKQHARVTEEAVAGWEQAEAEVAALKGLLEASSKKNASLEDQVSHLDKALKECVRQLRLAREEQEEKIRDIVYKKSQVLESENSELQNHIAELKKQLEVTRLEASSMLLQHDLQEKLQAIEKENLDLKAKLQAIERENMDLKAKLLVQSKDLKILLLERDLSNQAVETASKQHLESIKKIARVEAECRRLQHLTRKTALVNDSRPVQNNVCLESLTDSQSDNGERMVVVDNELRNSDSWASALIAELDQFKNGKDVSRNLVNNPVEIDIMDDFLEMERLAALPESDRTSSNFETETDSDKAVTRNYSSEVETEELQNQVTDLKEKFEAISSEKRELEMALLEVRNQLDISCDALVAAKNRLVEMQMQLDSENNSKLAAFEDVERLDSERKALELQLESKSVEVEELLMVVTSLEENARQKELESQLELMSTQTTELRLTVASLEERVQAERSLSLRQKANAEAARNAKEEMEAQLCSANTEMGKLRDVVKALGNEVEKEKALHEELTAQLQVKVEAAVDVVKESLEAQLFSANTEVEKLQGVIKALEDEVDKEKALHEELAAQVEVKIEAARTISVEAVKESLEAQLCSANTEIQKLREITKALENEVEKEKGLHEELSAQLEMKIEAERALSVESVKDSLEEQLELANSKAVKLRDMVTALDHDLEKEKVFSAELQMQLEALEVIKKVLESEVESAHQDARNLNLKVESLEAKLKEQVSSAEEFTAKAEVVQSERMAMEHQLETAERELIKLTNKVSLLHREIGQERLLTEEYEQKCRKLEAQLSMDSRDAKLWRLANSNGDLKVKKEKELANAAGKLAECQKTIASLGRRLESLTDLDSVVLEPERLESRDVPLPLDFRNGDAEFAVFADELYDFDLPNGDGSCFSPLPSIQPSSPPSEMSVFAGGLSTLSSYRSKRGSRG
ncbi:filament-like plant protein 1 [Phragmites australis]|uniref:filament-like plant protein 1 n=1 Tax=Phragmites australis TaxID=29695 RepID=UPI002D767530|nr:filament-like plant protein 1 [Phragmites australis]XP_062202202.1 filament-like plant protein 1 [Phragmites australis]XP_062202203.1 filament-like plant protein 1 [Phragmites australis]XP_062202204.1 filament-like plant protein 1 [Phragmites australis]